MFRFLHSLPCKLCAKRLSDTVQTHHQRLAEFHRIQEAKKAIRERQSKRMKYHLYNSSETIHQLDSKMFKRGSLVSTESKTYFH